MPCYIDTERKILEGDDNTVVQGNLGETMQEEEEKK